MIKHLAVGNNNQGKETTEDLKDSMEKLNIEESSSSSCFKKKPVIIIVVGMAGNFIQFDALSVSVWS